MIRKKDGDKKMTVYGYDLFRSKAPDRAKSVLKQPPASPPKVYAILMTDLM